MYDIASFRMVCPPGGSPAYNQAYEEVVFRQSPDGDLPLLMLWENPSAVVIGKHQNAYGEADVWRAHMQDLPLIRRESGGGAVTHGPGNLNYTLVLPVTESWQASDFAEPLIVCLRELGVAAQHFEHAGIAVNGQKVSGSAQRIVGRRILHHGTLLFDADLKAVEGALRRSTAIYNCKATRSRPATIANIRPYLLQDMDMAAFIQHISKRLGNETAPYAPSDLNEVDKLVLEKYATWDWTYARSPRFDYRKQISVDGEEWVLEYAFESGTMSQVGVSRNGQYLQGLSSLLSGQKLDALALSELADRGGEPELLRQILPHLFG